MTSRQQTVKMYSRPTPQPKRESKMVVEMKTDEIRKKAFDLAMARRSYDDYIWMWAEAELRLRNAYGTSLAPNAKNIDIDTSKIVDAPSAEDIKKLASELASKKVKVQDVHWFIAERQYIYNAIKTVL